MNTTTTTAATLRDAVLALGDAEMFTGLAIPGLTGSLALRAGRAQERIESALADLAPLLSALDQGAEDS